MIFPFKPKKFVPVLLLAAGVISLAFGILSYLTAPQDAAPNFDRLMGMFSGFGGGLVAVALFFLIRGRMLTPEKRMQEEVEQNDERNIAVQRAASSIAAVAALAIFAILAFVFTSMGYLLPAYLCIGAMYLELAVYLIALAVYRKKM
jgi:hypothetical protein